MVHLTYNMMPVQILSHPIHYLSSFNIYFSFNYFRHRHHYYMGRDYYK